MKSRIEIISRDAMQERIGPGGSGLPANTAVISFYDPPKKRGGVTLLSNPLDYTAVCDRVFRVAIHDIDIEILGDYGLSFETYFPEADRLAAFIYEAVEDGADIICQCEYGQSRSAACAAAILEHFEGRGIDVFADYRYYPNQMIFNKLRDALDRRRRGRLPFSDQNNYER